MAQSIFQGRRIAERIHGIMPQEQLIERISPRSPDTAPLPKRFPAGAACDSAAGRRGFMQQHYDIDAEMLDGANGLPTAESLQGNIENFIGYAHIPVGVIGPLRINGLYANGDYMVPLATTEGAMVASYHRGTSVISRAGGTSVMCLTESVSRAPCFAFQSLAECALFTDWVMQQAENFQTLIAQKTSHGELIDIKISCCGNLVYLIFEYTTGDAAGQNIVTVATENVCRHIVANSPVKPQQWYLEGNLSGDKKASMLSFMGARGKKVIASAVVPATLVKRYLHTTPEAMSEYCRVSALGGVQSGSIGVHGHYANALAGLFIACGQDVACVSEAAVGITQMTVNSDGDLAVSVTLPNLTVGTLGGGTHLPVAQACLKMLNCAGSGKARAFAEICAATILAGEISIIAALAAGQFAAAHARYRHRKPEE